MKIHLLTRRDFLAEHLDAVWGHLPEGLRGDRICEFRARAPKTWDYRDLVMVAAYTDIFATREMRTIYVEHGAGQNYTIDNDPMDAANYYHGGNHPEWVVGYIGPRQDVIDSWGRPGYAAGAPICDPYELFAPDKVAAITFHDSPGASRYIPEMRSAFDHYEPHLGAVVEALRDHGYEVLGHRHPRNNRLRHYWEREHQIREASPQEVRARAQLLIADNTSMAYEMLYLGRDVISLNAPWFRRDHHHGMRFWSHVPGVQVNSGPELIDLISELDKTHGALSDWSVCEYVYGKAHSDGLDGFRAATWLTKFAIEL